MINLVIFSQKSHVLKDFQGSICPAVADFRQLYHHRKGIEHTFLNGIILLFFHEIIFRIFQFFQKNIFIFFNFQFLFFENFKNVCMGDDEKSTIGLGQVLIAHQM